MLPTNYRAIKKHEELDLSSSSDENLHEQRIIGFRNPDEIPVSVVRHYEQLTLLVFLGCSVRMSGLSKMCSGELAVAKRKYGEHVDHV